MEFISDQAGVDNSGKTLVVSSDEEEEEEELDGEKQTGKFIVGSDEDDSDSADEEEEEEESSDSSSDDSLTQGTNKIIKKKKKKEKEVKPVEVELDHMSDLSSSDDDDDDSGSGVDSGGSVAPRQEEQRTTFLQPMTNAEDFLGLYNAIASKLPVQVEELQGIRKNRTHALFKRQVNVTLRKLEKDQNKVSDDKVWFHAACNVIGGLNKLKNGDCWETLESMEHFYESGILPRFEPKNSAQKKNVSLRSVQTSSSTFGQTSSNSSSMSGFDFDSIVPDEDELLQPSSRMRVSPKITMSQMLQQMGIIGYPDLAFKAEAVAYTGYYKKYHRAPELSPSTVVEYNTYVYDDTDEFKDLLRGSLFRAMCIMAQTNAGKAQSFVQSISTNDVSAHGQRHPQQQSPTLLPVPSVGVLNTTHPMPRPLKRARAINHLEGEPTEDEMEEIRRIEMYEQQQQQQQALAPPPQQQQQRVVNGGVCVGGFNMPDEDNNNATSNESSQFSGEQLPIGKVLDDLKINQRIQHDSTILNSFETQKKLRMAVGLKMKSFDEQSSIVRLRNEKGYKQYFESDRPNMMKATKLALEELGLNYVIPGL